jgi:hypothetical protein
MNREQGRSQPPLSIALTDIARPQYPTQSLVGPDARFCGHWGGVGGTSVAGGAHYLVMLRVVADCSGTQSPPRSQGAKRRIASRRVIGGDPATARGMTARKLGKARVVARFRRHWGDAGEAVREGTDSYRLGFLHSSASAGAKRGHAARSRSTRDLHFFVTSLQIDPSTARRTTGRTNVHPRGHWGGVGGTSVTDCLASSLGGFI